MSPSSKFDRKFIFISTWSELTAGFKTLMLFVFTQTRNDLKPPRTSWNDLKSPETTQKLAETYPVVSIGFRSFYILVSTIIVSYKTCGFWYVYKKWKLQRSIFFWVQRAKSKLNLARFLKKGSLIHLILSLHSFSLGSRKKITSLWLQRA